LQDGAIEGKFDFSGVTTGEDRNAGVCSGYDLMISDVYTSSICFSVGFVLAVLLVCCCSVLSR